MYKKSIITLMYHCLEPKKYRYQLKLKILLRFKLFKSVLNGGKICILALEMFDIWFLIPKSSICLLIH
jgi:hypothetical protein